MGDMIKGLPPLEGEPLFGPGAPRRRNSLLDFCRIQAEPVHYTVFLVEDDTDARGALLQSLQRSPYIHNVHWFDNGDAMLRHFVKEGYCSGKLLHNIPTIVLLDASLPGTASMEVLKRLKENPLTCNIPVVVMTDEYSDGLAAEAQKNKANAFIMKPASLARIHEVMQTGSSWPGIKSS